MVRHGQEIDEPTIPRADFEERADNRTSSAHASTDTAAHYHTTTTHVADKTNPTAVSTPPDPYRNPITVPYTTPVVYVYPHSGERIPGDHVRRFREVIDIFRQNTHRDERLRSGSKHIDYTLRMCGRTASESYPSILVFCRDPDFKDLDRLLKKNYLTKQYRRRKLKSESSWKSWSKNRDSVDGDANVHRTLFDLYFWRTSRPRELLSEGESPLFYYEPPAPIQDWHRLPTLCGASIISSETRQKVSTLGCLVTLGDEVYALTTYHGLRHDSGSDCPSLPSIAQDECSDTLFDSMDDYSDDSDEFEDDVVYEDIPEGDLIETVGGAISTDSTTLGLGPHALSRKDDFSHGVPPNAEMLREQEADLDWALLPISDMFHSLPNFYRTDNALQGECFIMDMAPHLPVMEVDVFILLRTGVKRGRLQPVLALNGGTGVQAMGEAWIVILEDGNWNLLDERFRKPSPAHIFAGFAQ
ncbi:hypothetical protein Micbo1qcDRAFT_200601 [Microdochium bolleyi]|uniref:Uncharacterized protein n=1 Tax=Microdochium bolleyi TaxID=196109 RepID=A0A136JDF1_9PEZI|nr:hypothetical protein Micbo1qcDRAFT_200601 [Microdochium bolleyi]